MYLMMANIQFNTFRNAVSYILPPLTHTLSTSWAWGFSRVWPQLVKLLIRKKFPLYCSSSSLSKLIMHFLLETTKKHSSYSGCQEINFEITDFSHHCNILNSHFPFPPLMITYEFSKWFCISPRRKETTSCEWVRLLLQSQLYVQIS